MKVGVKFDGGQQLANALKQLSTTVSRGVQVDALTAGAGFIQRTASDLAPRSSQDKEHLADNIVIGAVGRANLDKRGRETETVVEVGPALKPNDFFYGLFPELGTATRAATPYLRPAFDQEAPRALFVIRTWLWDAIKKRIPSFRR